ncbi:DNA primase TraC [mine drainage metagenome]|uniref:DNA primase TraC n=1 Tax=mine drainage metagenome TaxID=410659 RepID=A0A1J5R0E3_9ZZZZ
MTGDIDQFKSAIRAYGMTPPDVIVPGRIEFYRFPGDGKHGSNKAGWCKLFADGRGGIFGDYSTGLSESWQAAHDKPCTKAETEAFKRQVIEAKAKAEAETATEQAAAREQAILTLAEAVAAQSHDYLTRKGVQAHGAKLHDGRLVLTIRDGSGDLQSLQFIGTDGGKKYLPGGKVKGGYFSIGKGKPDGVICVCEGFATGASINESTGYAVAVAFDCGNLLSVARVMRAKFPDIRLIICADDDYRTNGNPGITKATEAAHAVDGLVAVPDFGNDRPDGATDFNDLHQLDGVEAVRKCIEAAALSPVAVLNVVGGIEALTEEADAVGSAPATPSTDDEVIAWLAGMKPLAYERVRVDQAKLMGCRPAVLDALVKSARNDDTEAERLPFPEVEPHHSPIDPAQLLGEVSDTIRRFIVLDDEQADAAALWVAFTWFIEVVQVAPLAIVNAPEKACGKSQLLDLMGRISARPLPAANATTAALFRSIELWHPTLLVDECDTFIKENEELKGLINAGYTRSNAFVLRVVGDDHTPKQFSVWGAKALAGIALEKHLPDATMSRAIVIELRRKLSHEQVIKLRDAGDGLFEGIAAKLARFADDYAQQVQLARPTLPDALGDRAQDNWQPLLAIASCAGAEWMKRATAAALKLSGSGDKSVSTGNELLADIQHVFESKQADKISTVDLIAALCEDDEGAWATYNRGKQIAPRQVARQLARYGIASKTVRIGYGTPKGFEIEQFLDVFERYLSAPRNFPQHRNNSLEANIHAVCSVSDNPQHNSIRNNSKTLEPAPALSCGVVADKPPILGSAELTRTEPSSMRI